MIVQHRRSIMADRGRGLNQEMCPLWIVWVVGQLALFHNAKRGEKEVALRWRGHRPDAVTKCREVKWCNPVGMSRLEIVGGVDATTEAHEPFTEFAAIKRALSA